MQGITMKMKAEFNLEGEPEELRRFFGMPDVAKLQEEIMSQITSKMNAGVEGFDPLTLMKPFFSLDNLKAWQDMQNNFWQNMVDNNLNKESKSQNKK